VVLGLKFAAYCIRVSQAHEICDRIEAALKSDMDGEALVTIHVEPEVQAKLSGVSVL
jgi:divalent metal cation (Fe/Co/Zn/Cd) transporter